MIFYTGVGAKPDGIHSDEEFIVIMKKHFAHKDQRFELQFCSDDEKNVLTKFKDYILPHDFIFFSLDDWIDYSGANIINQKKLTITS